jgi:hypothetical protein
VVREREREIRTLCVIFLALDVSFNTSSSSHHLNAANSCIFPVLLSTGLT